MTLTRGKTFLIENIDALPRVGAQALGKADAIFTSIDKHIDTPFRLYATEAAADGRLNIGPSQVVSGDGGIKSFPPVDDALKLFGGSFINVGDGSAGGNVLFEGNSFTMPVVADGEYVRMVLVYVVAINKIDTTFSVGVADQANLEDPGVLLAGLEGEPLGYIDLKYYTGLWYGSATSGANDLVINSDIYRFSAGTGSGGGGDSSFKFQSMTNGIAKIKKGFIRVSDGTTLLTGDGTTSLSTPVDLDIDLHNVPSDPIFDSESYYLYIDREALDPFVELTDIKRIVQKVYADSHFAILDKRPDQVNPERYVSLGYLRASFTATSIPATRWSAGGIAFATSPTRTHDELSKAFNLVRSGSQDITVEAASNLITHGLGGIPNSLMLTYFDGSSLSGLDLSVHLVGVTDTQIDISTLGLTMGSGEYMTVRYQFSPSTPEDIGFAGMQYLSPWMENTGTTVLAHALQDMEDIRGYAVQEWDVSAGNRKNLTDPNALVKFFDDTNFELDWTGIVPSATLKYRIVAGSRALPMSVPTNVGGFTKFVGVGTGHYPTITEALAASGVGDSILVKRSYSIAAPETCALNDVKITFMPGVFVTVTAGSDALLVTGDRVIIENAHYKINIAGTLATAIHVSGEECEIVRAKIEAINAGLTITAAYRDSGILNYLQGLSKATLGTIAATYDPSGSTDADASIRG